MFIREREGGRGSERAGKKENVYVGITASGREGEGERENVYVGIRAREGGRERGRGRMCMWV